MERELYELKEILVDELKKYGKKGDLSTGSLDVVDKLAHATKNLGKVIEMCEESEGNYSSNTMSYARGRNNVMRDTRGRYSRTNSEFTAKLEELMRTAPDEHTRMEIERLMSKIDM